MIHDMRKFCEENIAPFKEGNKYIVSQEVFDEYRQAYDWVPKGDFFGGDYGKMYYRMDEVVPK